MHAVELLVGNLLVVAWSWPVLFYVSIFAHELGHALAGWAMGFTITSFGLGIGRPFAVLSWSHAVLSGNHETAPGAHIRLTTGVLSATQKDGPLSGRRDRRQCFAAGRQALGVDGFHRVGVSG